MEAIMTTNKTMCLDYPIECYRSAFLFSNPNYGICDKFDILFCGHPPTRKRRKSERVRMMS